MEIYANSGKTIHIGRLGENRATKVVFDLSKIWSDHGDGNATLWVNIGPNTYTPYNRAVTEQTTRFVWEVTDADTSVEGIGGCQIFYSWSSGDDSTNIAKSPIYPIVVTNSIDSSSPVIPSEYASWLETIDEKLAEAARIIEAEEAIMGMTAEATTVDHTAEASVTTSKVEDHINLEFQIPRGKPFSIVQTYGKIEDVYAAWDDWALQDVVIIQADSGIDNGNVYTKVTKESFIYPPSEYRTITRHEDESVHAAANRVTSPYTGLYVVVDDTWVLQYFKGDSEESPSWHALWMKGWDYMCNMSGAQGIQGPRGYTVTSATIDSTGLITFVTEDGRSLVVSGPNFYTYLNQVKTTTEAYKDSARESAVNAISSASAASNSASAAAASVTSAAEQATAAAASAGIAESSADAAHDSEVNAGGSETNAAASETNAAASAVLAESWAVGGTSSRSGEDSNNAKYYAEQSESYVDDAEDQAEIASKYARGKDLEGTDVTTGDVGYQDNAYYYKEQAAVEVVNAESWAVGGTGTRSGEDTDNAKYYAEQSAASATDSAASASDASGSAVLAESWAIGGTGTRTDEDTDNAQYYATQASGSADEAEEQRLDSEAYAAGTRDGVEVESTDPAYHNNAKWYRDQAAAIIGDDYVKYTEQSKTESEKATARTNIGAVREPDADGTLGQVLTIGVNGVRQWQTVDIPDATTSTKGKVQLEDSVSSSSTLNAATANSVRVVYSLANGKITEPNSDGNDGQVLTTDGAGGRAWRSIASVSNGTLSIM